MRTALDRLGFYVMNATADDWESLEQIMSQTTEFARVTDRSQVAHQIVELLREGLLQEMKKTPVTLEMIVQTPAEYWFGMTARGRTVWQSQSQRYVQQES